MAARVIGEVAGRGKSLDRALAPALENFEDGRDRAFLQAICYGVLRFHPRLEFLLEQLLNRPLKARDIRLRALMLTGLYQISSMGVPAHAAVAESVAAAQEIGRPGAKGLVNAVLRRYIRERTNLDGLAMLSPEARWAHPEWLINRLATDWPDRWQSVLEENNRQPPMWLRVNCSRIAREDYLKELEQPASPGAYASESLCLDAPVPVGSLPGFSQGLVSVQDAGAQLTAGLLDVRPGHRVLDACAAPGGKAAHILELCSDVARLCHKINNPLTSLMGRAQMLQMQPDPTPEKIAKASEVPPAPAWKENPSRRIPAASTKRAVSSAISSRSSPKSLISLIFVLPSVVTASRLKSRRLKRIRYGLWMKYR